MGFFYTNCGRFVSDTLDYPPKIYLTQKGIKDTKSCIKIQRCWRNYLFRIKRKIACLVIIKYIKCHIEMNKKQNAAIKIQRYWRNYKLNKTNNTNKKNNKKNFFKTLYNLFF